MDRYGTGSEPDPTEPPSDEEFAEAPEDAESDTAAEDVSVGYADIKRWFEGTSEFADSDIPDFEGDGDAVVERPPASQAPPDDPVPPGNDHPAAPSAPARIVDTPTKSNEMTSTQTPDAEIDRTPRAVAQPDPDPVDTLLATIRSPSAPLPPMVDDAFLAGILHFVNADVRKMHEDRAWIRSVTGFPWPEEKPNTDEMPALYADALRYPSFAIVAQHLFLEDTFRGLPKNQTRRQYTDLSKRARREKPLPRHERHVHVLQALQILEIGGDLDVVIADLLSMPGHFAWNMKCSAVTDGLTRLETNEKLAPIASYLQKVLGPFKNFGEDATIREVFESTIIPQALRRPAAPDASREVESTELAKVDDRPPPANEAELDAQEPVIPDPEMHPIDTREAAASRWNAVWAQIVELGAVAGSAGPSSEPLERLRAWMGDLEAIRAAFEDLAPKLHSTAEVRDALRTAISEISAGLDELHGESFNAPALLSALFEVSELAEPEAVIGADGLVEKIRALLTESTSLASQIADIEAKLPKMKAKAETDPLIHRHDKLLRDALGLAGSAVELLPTHRNETPAALPPSDTGHGTGVVEQEGAPTVDPDRTEDVIDDDLIDVQVGDVAELRSAFGFRCRQHNARRTALRGASIVGDRWAHSQLIRHGNCHRTAWLRPI
jgi:hypothetical protein